MGREMHPSMRKRMEDSEITEEIPVAEPEIRIKPEYCDAPGCPARATRVILPYEVDDGQLSFCQHHWNKYEPELIMLGHVIELDKAGL